ncbi:response regulator [Ktedonosporobacter rubrisoli]|uniref:Response regulator n=1 Tax=Ktedonosporobacter rubrisoli TaxID=2509675 RepID=A0A4P6K1V3_KTERU|nr:response regulator [Ktedonosporobacter rubrisoli]QBD82167.1 response regulator [Ktedonosporobacter rubrisoli]
MSFREKILSLYGSSKYRCILLAIYDSQIGADLVDRIMQTTPYLAVRVPNSFEVLECTRYIKPDLLILDESLPGMDGLELYDQLRRRKKLEKLAAIILAIRTGDAGGNGQDISIVRSFGRNSLLRRIEKLLQG